jgi:hypothetical protein
MKRLILISLCVLVVAGTASGSAANNTVGTPYKWTQLPDTTSLGLDVDSTTPGKLADDFWCDATGPITEVHIWGSWLGDILPYGDANAVTFTLRIYSDVPEGAGPSQPGEQLWDVTLGPGDFTVQKYADALEDWYDPVSGGEYLSQNHSGVWLYSFIAPPDACDLFYQEASTIYWLGIEASPQDGEAVFGWKTSVNHWNDDAVYDEPISSWLELRYPDGHEYQGQSIDLAFVVGGIPEPATICLLGLGALSLLRKRRV